MPSNIDTTFPVTNVLTSKGQMRKQWTVIKSEIEALQEVFVTAQSFGATGDGITDDTAAIQAAIATGRSVLFLPGRFLISSSLVLSAQGQRLVGQGRYASILRPAGNFDAVRLSGASGMGMESIGISSTAYNSMSGGHSISVINAPRAVINDVLIVNCHNGIHVEGSNHFTAHSVYISGISGAYAFKAYGSAGSSINTLNLFNCNFTNTQSTYKGVWIDGLVHNVRIYSLAAVLPSIGLHVTNTPGATGTKPRYIAVHDLKIDTPSAQPVLLEAGDTFWFSEPDLQGSTGEAGFVVQSGATTGLISQAYIRGHRKEAMVLGAEDWAVNDSQIGFTSIGNHFVHDCIRLTSTARTTRIMGSSIGGMVGSGATTRAGIGIDSGAQRTSIIGNDLTKAITPIRDEGTNTVIMGNTGVNFSLQRGLMSGNQLGFGARATAFVVNGAVTSVTVDSQGSGYVAGATVYIESYGIGSGFAANATVTGGRVTGITVTNGGSGYTGPVAIYLVANTTTPTIRAWRSDGTTYALSLAAAGAGSVHVRNDNAELAVFQDDRIAMKKPVQFMSTTRAALPAANGHAGSMVHLSDGATGGMLAYSTGQFWFPITGRARMTVPLTLYVSPTGSDTNTDGLTLGTAFRTLQAAWDTAMRDYDLAGNILTIQMQPGTYSGGLTGFGTPSGYMNNAIIRISGNPANPASVHFSVNGETAFNFGRTYVELSGIRISAPQGIAVSAREYSSVRFHQVDFGPAAAAHFLAHDSYINVREGYRVSGSAPVHAWAGRSWVNLDLATITFASAVSFATGFAHSVHNSLLSARNTSFVNPHLVTGVRYAAQYNSSIAYTADAPSPETFFPGTIAGSVGSSSHYTT